MGKIVAEKMMFFPTVLFLGKTMPEMVEKSIFLSNFQQTFSKISQRFVPVFFVETREKLAQAL